MKRLFQPEAILSRYQDLDYRLYYEKGYRVLLVDIDNTLVPYYCKDPDDNAKAFLNAVQECGYQVIIFSNNNPQRVCRFASGVSLKAYYRSLKPLKITYKRILKENDIDPSRVICMGDQLLTDVLGAKRMGLCVFYVKPIISKDSYTTVINRAIERLIFRYILHEKV